MPKMTVAEAAEHFNVSKEAIHNRVRRGTLNSVIENGVKYVLLPHEQPSSRAESRFHEYIEKENEQLKAKNEQLQTEITRLRDQREAMLIDEREKIEQIYKERDEQLRTVLQMFASKLLPEKAVAAFVDEAVSAEIVEEDEVEEVRMDAQIVEEEIHEEEAVFEEEQVFDDFADKPDPFEDDDFDDLVTLKDFLKLKGFGKKQRQRIKERFQAHADADSRIIVRNGRLHLRPYHYDYSDLLT